MNKQISTLMLAIRIWFLTSLMYSLLTVIFTVVCQKEAFIAVIIFPLSLLVTIPACIALGLTFFCINWLKWQNRIAWLAYSIATGFIIIFYGNLNTALLGELFGYDYAASYLHQFLWASSYITLPILIANLCSLKFLQQRFHQSSFKNKNMEQNNFNTSNEFVEVTSNDTSYVANKSPENNKPLIKAIIMGIMVVVLLIPTLFISNLVEEREKRQASVVQEVCNKWANDQTIGTPFIYLPYTEKVKVENKEQLVTRDLFLLPQNLNVQGNLLPEVRPRSIYKVYLYKSTLKVNGNFAPTIPNDVAIEQIDFSKAKLCFLLNDIKGIDEKLVVQFNGANYDFAPGLPFAATFNKWVDAPKIVADEYRSSETVNTTFKPEGLSVTIPFTKEMIGKALDFSLVAKINGSENLRFLPLAANSKFSVQSSWANPKFDGNKVPSERVVNDSGFAATWNFNSANLPFGTALKEFIVQPSTYAFGVSMVQPADHYSKTNRCIKYAILFIALSFALFFIIELMQKKPLHPVQYILVGVALLVFFTLLLSISEFLLFDYAYAIAASATVLLISLYAKAHFKSNSTALIFASFIGGLYSFIFVLIRLEDTALLVGSIGLFVILSIAMYASRKINWYSNTNI
ncbi:MAG: cell envelope integrity protein CreD [Chitinophagaceae bacterium]